MVFKPLMMTLHLACTLRILLGGRVQPWPWPGGGGSCGSGPKDVPLANATGAGRCSAPRAQSRCVAAWAPRLQWAMRQPRSLAEPRCWPVGWGAAPQWEAACAALRGTRPRPRAAVWLWRTSWCVQCQGSTPSTRSRGAGNSGQAPCHAMALQGIASLALDAQLGSKLRAWHA